MKIFSLAVMILFISLSADAQQLSNEKLEAKVIARVHQVAEVKIFFERGKNYERKPDLMIDNEPHKNFNYYEVKMGYGGEMFSTLERFCVDPKTFKVYYWDFMADDMAFSNSSIISLSQWRALRKTAAWKKPHGYRHGKLIILAKH